jgi:hypothetical protein
VYGIVVSRCGSEEAQYGSIDGCHLKRWQDCPHFNGDDNAVGVLRQGGAPPASPARPPVCQSDRSLRSCAE